MIILGNPDIKISTPEEITYDVIHAISKKYAELQKTKIQMSIYLDNTLLEKLEKKAKETRKKPHDIIIEAIYEKTRGIFYDDKHQIEFSKFIKGSDLYSESDTYIDGSADEKQKKLTAFFYIISAYQDDYLEFEGSKFEYDGNTKTLSGPINLIDDWELGVCDRENLLGLALLIMDKVENPGKNLLANIFYDFPGLDNNDKAFFIAMNAFRILGAKITLYKDSLVYPRKSKSKRHLTLKF